MTLPTTTEPITSEETTIDPVESSLREELSLKEEELLAQSNEMSSMENRMERDQTMLKIVFILFAICTIVCTVLAYFLIARKK